MFDPRKTVIIEIKKIQRELFWGNVWLAFKVLGIAATILALALWLIWEKFGA